jgi:hypothetical protein
VLQLETLALGFFGAASRQHDDELVASVAHAHVVRPDIAAEHSGDLAQRAIANVVSVGVVDALEVVEVHDQQRHFRAQAAGAGELSGQMHEHVAGVLQPGERIGERVLLRLLEHERVIEHGRRLLGDAVEQPAVVVRVDRLGRVVDR